VLGLEKSLYTLTIGSNSDCLSRAFVSGDFRFHAQRSGPATHPNMPNTKDSNGKEQRKKMYYMARTL
jgi:hypothetical protein